MKTNWQILLATLLISVDPYPGHAQWVGANPAPITIDPVAYGYAEGPALLYPSTIGVSNLAAAIARVTVTISNLHHTYPSDLDVLLVGPTGTRALLMSDAGLSFDVTNITLTFDDSAARSLPAASPLVSGVFQPTDFVGGLFSDDAFPPPAPSGPYGHSLGDFTNGDPNGVWSLYVFDEDNGDAGAISGGWQLSIEAQVSLHIVKRGDQVELSWPQGSRTYQLEHSASLASANWLSLTNTPIAAEGQWRVSAPLEIGTQFYRLKGSIPP